MLIKGLTNQRFLKCTITPIFIQCMNLTPEAPNKFSVGKQEQSSDLLLEKKDVLIIYSDLL